MAPERFRKVEQLYEAALKQIPPDRKAFLDQACEGDPDLRREVQSLLDAHSEAKTQSITDPLASNDTALAPGSVLGQYRIGEQLGAGGMGVVYKATDTKLGRTAALKLLRPEMVMDRASMARLQREARTLASLNDPRIAVIYGLEEQNGICFLALEYVAGPTLAERLKHGALRIHDAVTVAVHIAEALETAHSKSIIHRDLKPANVKVTDDMQVKVLDFGLAKEVHRGAAAYPDDAPTVTEPLTEKLTIVGTAPYMSPEQAKAKELDARTDIWAFGCVLYEMLTGRRAFVGSTLTEVLAGVLERDPDWTALPPGTPPRLLLLLKRCLRKEPVNRLRDIGDARIELQDLLSGAADEPGGAPDRRLSRRTALAALGGTAAGASLTGAFAIARYKGALPRRLTQIAIATPEPSIFIPSFNRRIAISPDGGRVVFNVIYAGADAFFVRSLAALQPDRVKDVPNGAAAFFSPDGQWFGFLTAFTGGYSYGTGAVNTMRKLALSGGAPVTICPVDAFCGATWSEDGNIYWVDSLPGGVMSIPANGGTAKEVSKPDFSKGERLYKYPCAIPGGEAVLVTLGTVGATTFDDAQIVAVRTRTGEKKVLVEGGTHPRYSPTGHLLYARDGKILAVRFDPKRLVVQGQPRVVLEGVQMSRNTGVANFDVSAGGDLAYVAGICDGGARTLAWIDRDGRAEQVPLPARSYLHPRLSPDSQRLAIEVEGINHDLYVYDFDRGVLANLTTDGVSHWPVWSPDGSKLAFRSGPMGHFTIWHVPADRSGERQQVTATGPSQNAESWSPDGGTIAYTAMSQSTPPTIMAARLDGQPAERVSKDNSPEGSPKFSPDGRWIAFCAIESGKPQVFVQSFPGPGPKIQVSAEGGTDPVWRRQGGELYYRNGDSMMVVETQTTPKFVAGRPRELWRGHYSHGMSSSCGPPGATSSNYDVTPDGKRFLMIKDDDQDRAASKQFVVVLGWGDELSRRDATA